MSFHMPLKYAVHAALFALALVGVPSGAAPASRVSANTPTTAPGAPRAVATPDKAANAAAAWEIRMADRTLNAALARWAATAGWQLLWELPVDYAVQVSTSVPGTFEEAVTLVVNSMESAEIPMKAVFYSGNRVLRVMPKGAR